MMMKKLLLFISCFLGISLFSGATHIVGGGFTYQLLQGNVMRLQLTLYFDDINGNIAALDEMLNCHFFEKRTNTYLRTEFVPLIESSEFVPYTNPPCASTSGVRTKILKYSSDIILEPQIFNQIQGYYVVWERCCRNGNITNIEDPGGSGQVFFMEFPPIISGGNPFTNSAPVFRPIKADYPCVNENFNLAFGADDADGDSLVYALCTPLRGNSTANAPNNVPAFAAPYSKVTWLPGFDSLKAIPGTPPLKINPVTGELTCKPNQTGLFVFSVRCTEYRNGKKIGEVRREMQILVKDCIPNSPPDIIVRNPFNNTQLTNEDTLLFEITNKRVCNKIVIRDPQLEQTIRFQVRTLASNVPNNLIRDTLVNFSSSDSLVVPFCIDPCLSTPQDQVWRVMFYASDNGCSFSKSDSLIVNIIARLRLDSIKKPTVFTELALPETLDITQTEPLQIKFNGLQTQDANLGMTSNLVDNLGNPVSSQGIILPLASGKRLISSQFQWPEICFIPPNPPLKLTVLVNADYCLQIRSDTIVKYLNIIPKDIEVTINSERPDGDQIILKTGQSVSFPVTGTVSDNRAVQLNASGPLVQIPGFQFPGAQGQKTVSSTFSGGVDCKSPSGSFPIMLKAISQFCSVNYADSLQYTVIIEGDKDSLGIVPNLLTANGDNKNDGLILRKILPNDNCFYQFDFVEIYNRWGNQVFFSRDPDFRWMPEKGMEGVYFYSLHMKEKTFTTWLAVVK